MSRISFLSLSCFFTFLISIFAPSVVLASQEIDFTLSNEFSVFTHVYNPVIPDIAIPTLVQVEIPDEQDYPVGLVIRGSNTPQPFRMISLYEDSKIHFSVADSSLSGEVSALVDHNNETSVEFGVDGEYVMDYVVMETQEAVISTRLDLLLDTYVALPNEIQISAEVDGEMKIVLARSEVKRRSVHFPETYSKKWKVEMWHAQPLRLLGIDIVNKDQELRDVGERIMWLAQPEATYKLYTGAVTDTGIKTSEAPNLYPDKDDVLLTLDLGRISDNPSFKEPDTDGDGVVDVFDNCVIVENSDQIDVDGNGLGDACEDHDRDGVINLEDNCPDNPNRYQADEDMDGIGDECDSEESRPTEKLPWLPWLVMGLAAVLIIGMMMNTMKAERK